MNGGEAVVAALRAAGVTHIFGLLGSTTMEVYDALYGVEDIKYVGVRDERAGVHMADAFGRLSRTPGVFLAGQAGPGAANMVTALAQAKLAYSPVVAITGLASSTHLGRDAFQEIDQQTLFSAVTKKTMTVPRADRIAEFIREAFRIANSGRRGPVVVQIARDLFAQEIGEVSADQMFPAHQTSFSVDDATITSVLSMLEGAQRPLIIGGAGIKWARGSENLAKAAEALGVPVVASAGHGDIMPNDHPLFFGQVGPRGNPVASRLAREADVIIALGTRLGFNTTFYTYDNLSRDAKIVQVDVEAEALGRYFPINLGVLSDAGSFANVLLSKAQGRAANAQWNAWRDGAVSDRVALWNEREAEGASEQLPLSAARVFKEIRDALPRDAIVTIDAGTMCLQATDQLKFYSTPGLVSPLDFGLVGFSYAAGLGAKAAAPHRPVVSLMGDGGFAMTMAEITTAVSENLSTVAVILDNGCWGAEKAYQRDFYDGRYVGADVPPIPYNAFAELVGAKGYSVSKPGELAATLAKAIASGEPSVIQVKVDPNAIISFRRNSFKHRVKS